MEAKAGCLTSDISPNRLRNYTTRRREDVWFCRQPLNGGN